MVKKAAAPAKKSRGRPAKSKKKGGIALWHKAVKKAGLKLRDAKKGSDNYSKVRAIYDKMKEEDEEDSA